MEELAGFGMKISLTLPSLANKILIVLGMKTMNQSIPITMNICVIL